MEEKSILIIDEEERVHEMLGNFLEERKLKVYHSFNGEEGIRKMFQIFPDCVILEVLLSRKNGLEIIKECRVSPRVGHIPFILYTLLYFDENELKKGINLGGHFYLVKPDAYFQKPTSPEIIFEKIQELIGKEEKVKATKGKILIIEDDFDTIFLLKKILEGDNYSIEYARKGYEGLRKIEEVKPDLVLLDYILPDTDGMEMLLRIKETYQDIPVVIMTAYGSEDLAVEILKKGADDYLAKPFPISREILLKIEENIQKRRKRKKEEIMLSSMKEMNDWIVSKYFALEEAERKILSLEKDTQKIAKEKMEEIRAKYTRLRENISMIKEDLDLFVRNFEDTLRDIREKLAYLKPEENKFPPGQRELTGRIREGLQRLEVILYKIKDKISMLGE